MATTTINLKLMLWVDDSSQQSAQIAFAVNVGARCYAEQVASYSTNTWWVSLVILYSHGAAYLNEQMPALRTGHEIVDRINIKAIKDDIASNKCGYSFVTDQRNDFSECRDYLPVKLARREVQNSSP
jgi:hypothetical protein